MKCIVCDRCKKIIETPRNCRVITCAKPLKLPTQNCKVPYRGNDRQQNDIIWEKEICSDCLDALEEFFEQTVDPVTPEPEHRNSRITPAMVVRHRRTLMRVAMKAESKVPNPLWHNAISVYKTRI